MPRPKRTKVASTVARVAKPSEAPVQLPTTQQQSRLRKPTAPKPAESVSEDSDGLVFKATRARRQAPQLVSQEEVGFTMTGALPAASETDTPEISSKNRTPASNASRRARKSIDSVQGSSSRKSSRVTASAKSRLAEKDASHVATEDGDSSGFGDLSFTSLGSDSPAHGTRPPSAIKVGATPAHERSILALTNFRRRPRQPSLLRMVHQTTDLEDNDLDDLDLSDLEDCKYCPHTYSIYACAHNAG